MIKKRSLLLIIILILLLIPYVTRNKTRDAQRDGAKMAARMPPKKVEPVILKKRGAPHRVDSVQYGTIKFIAPCPNSFHTRNIEEWESNRGKMGYVQAWDVKTNKKIWEKRIYEVTYDPNMESDVQDVYITSLNIEDDKLVVKNERFDRYEVSIDGNYINHLGKFIPPKIKKQKLWWKVEKIIWTPWNKFVEFVGRIPLPIFILIHIIGIAIIIWDNRPRGRG